MLQFLKSLEKSSLGRKIGGCRNPNSLAEVRCGSCNDIFVFALQGDAENIHTYAISMTSRTCMFQTIPQMSSLLENVACDNWEHLTKLSTCHKTTGTHLFTKRAPAAAKKIPNLFHVVKSWEHPCAGKTMPAQTGRNPQALHV